MPTIKNMSYGPTAINGKEEPIMLGPRETKDISTEDFESDGVLQALRDELVEVLSVHQPEKKPKHKPNSE
jgi:hypothetical protein